MDTANLTSVQTFRLSAHATLKFIGRTDELKRIESAIADRGHNHIFYIAAEGGTGKTRLLREVIDRLQDGRWSFPDVAFTKRLADLYDLKLHNPEGLAVELFEALEVSRAYFNRFREKHAELELARREQSGESLEAIAEARQELTDAFIFDFNWLARERRIVIVLDTAEMLLYEPSEVLQDLLEETARPDDPEFLGVATRRWLLDSFLPRIHNTVVLIAGRPLQKRLPDDLGQVADRHAAVFETIDLGNFTERETIAYFDAVAEASRSLGDESTAQRIEREIPEETRRVIHLYTGGNPILLGLMVDYLVRAETLVPDVQVSLDEARQENLAKIQEKLRAKIVELIQRAGEPEDEAIRSLAWARKGMKAQLLARVADLTEEEARYALERIRRLSFVKVHPSDPELFFLHDEMYALMRQYVLEALGPAHRRHVYRVIFDYYSERIREAEEDLEHLLREVPVESEPADDHSPSDPASPTNSEQLEAWQARLRHRNLVLGYVHYRLREDPVEGFVEYYKRAEEAFLAVSDDFDMQLRSELLAFWQQEEQVVGHPLEEIRGLRRVDVNSDAAIRWVKRYISHRMYERALRLVNAIRTTHRRLLPSRASEAELSAWEALASSYLGEQLSKVGHLLADAIDVLTRAETKELGTNVDRRELVQAQLYNRLGYLYRVKGQSQQAVQAYQRALPFWQKHGAQAALANTLNNLAFAYAQVGKFDAALHAGQRALRIRRKLGLRLPIALSLNTIGLIQTRNDQSQRARVSIGQALSIFTELGRQGIRGVGLANIALSEAMRRTCNIPIIYTTKKKAEFLRQARDHAQAALEIFPDQVNDKLRYVEALVELGCVYRDWAKLRREHPADEPGEETNVLAELGVVALNRAAREAHSEMSNWEVDALVNLAWLHYYIGQIEKALGTAQQVDPLIPEQYRLKEGKGIPEHKGPISSFYIQLGKIHNLRGQIAFDAKDWKAAAHEFTLALAYNQCFADDFRDLKRAQDQISERLDELDYVQLTAFRHAVAQAEHDYNLTSPGLLQQLILELSGDMIGTDRGGQV